MNAFLSLVIALAFSTSASAATGPLRVLYLGKDGTPSARHCASLMRDLGRDAIWFDYAANPALVTPEWLARFDAVLLDAPQDGFQALPGAAPQRVVAIEFPRDRSGEAFPAEVKEKLLAAAGDARRKSWEAFLAQREPEKREANATIANYEKRKEPVTLQHPFSVKGSIERTQVPPDMRLVLFAAEPDIMKPIAFAWDERGRLWVAETRDYPHGVKPDGAGNDSIKICEDTDGDGRADKFTVFADKLNIPTSIVLVNGGAIVAQPPRFLFLRDTDGDDQADVREVAMEGWGVKDTHAQANSLHYGYDNWLHGCVGYSGFKGTIGGKSLAFGQGTYRFKADGSALEFLHQFSNNSWGQSQNAAGDDFGGTANNAPIFYGGIPATIVPAGVRAMTAKKINLEDKAHAITPYFRQVDVMGGYTAAAGSAFIYSANLPARLQGQALVTEPTMKLIALMDVQPDGAGYVARDGFNLVASTDEWMSPVFAEVGPDGAIWFADWQNFIIQHNPTPSLERGGYTATTGIGGAHENPLRDHQRGRIYRVVWEKAGPPAVKTLQHAGTADLVRALGSDTQHWRLTAQRLLVEGRRADAAPALKQLVTANDARPAAIHALWALQGLGQLDGATHKAALLAKDPALRRNAVRALGSSPRDHDLLFGAGVISDPDLHTRLATFVKLADFPTTSEIQTLIRQITEEPAVKGDEWLREAARVLEKKHKASKYREGPNLLPNPTLEIVGPDDLPAGWKRRDYADRPGNKDAEWKTVSGPGDTHGGASAVRCIARTDADTSLTAEVPARPNTLYRLSGWVKTRAFRGRASLNVHGTPFETERATAGESGWTEIDTTFTTGDQTTLSINLLHVARGESYFDDVKLCELLPEADATEKPLAADPQRGEQIFAKHPTAACVLCHMVKGQGSTVGPALDGIAARMTPAQILESLLEPGKTLAKGFEALGVSPMPPMGLILKPQELEDIQAYLQTLK